MRARLTKAGYEKLRKELEYLRTTKRAEMARTLEAARSHGDLRENAEYDSAKHEQALLEKRIAELDGMLSGASILDDKDIESDKAYVGAAVTMKDLMNNKEVTYTLVSKAEANLQEGKIAIESPVGKALLGKGVGEEIEVITPARTSRYKIINIER